MKCEDRDRETERARRSTEPGARQPEAASRGGGLDRAQPCRGSGAGGDIKGGAWKSPEVRGQPEAGKRSE